MSKDSILEKIEKEYRFIDNNKFQPAISEIMILISYSS